MLLHVVGLLMESKLPANCLRVRYLASASDDETIRIWKRDESYVFFLLF